MFNQLGMVGLNSLLGTQACNGYQNGFGQMNNQLQQQYNHQYTQSMMMNKPTWVFNGQTCTVREMADMIWPTDSPEKTHFLLKYE